MRNTLLRASKTEVEGRETVIVTIVRCCKVGCGYTEEKRVNVKDLPVEPNIQSTTLESPDLGA